LKRQALFSALVLALAASASLAQPGTGPISGGGGGGGLPGANQVTESMLKVVNACTDEYVLTCETTTGDFEWQALRRHHRPTFTTKITTSKSRRGPPPEASTATLDGDSTVAGVGTVTKDGRFKAGVAGSATAPAFELSAGNAGMYDDRGTGGVALKYAAGTSFSVVDGTTYRLLVDANQVIMSTGLHLGWGTIGGLKDIGLKRLSAGNLHVSDGNGGDGNLSANKMTVATGSSGGVVIGSTLRRSPCEKSTSACS
jgi:hypothetical protein